MSNTNTNRSQPDILSGILGRLNGTVAKVTKLRQFLGDLESELNEIRQECENELYARTGAAKDNHQTRKRDLMKQNAHMAHSVGHAPVSSQSRERDHEPIVTDRLGEQRSTVMEPGPKSKPMKSKRKGHPSASTPGGSSLSIVSGGSKLSAGGPMKARNWLGFMSILLSRSSTAAAPKHAKRSSVAGQIRFQHPSKPPTNPSPFPKVIDLSAYPPELKCVGPDWFVLFNPSPKVKRVLDVNLVHTLKHGSGVLCVRFSRDGKWLATGSGKSAQVYEVETGSRICILDHASYVYIRSVCFSPDRKYLTTGAEDKQVRVWNIANKRSDHILDGHQGVVFSVEFSPNGRFIVSGSGDGTVRVWDTHDWTAKVLTINDHYLLRDNHGVISVAISPDGRYVAAGGNDTVVGLWEITTGVLTQRLRGHKVVIRSVVFTPDGRGLISGSWDGILKYWDVSWLGIGSGIDTALIGTSSTCNTSSTSSSPCLVNFTGHIHSIYCTAVSYNGTWVVSGSEDGKVLFWDTRTGVVQCMLSGHKDGVYGVDLSSTDNFLATAGWDGKVRIWSYGPLR